MRQIPAQRLCQKTSRGYVGGQRRQKGMFVCLFVYDFPIIIATTSKYQLLAKRIISLGVIKTNKKIFSRPKKPNY